MPGFFRRAVYDKERPPPDARPFEPAMNSPGIERYRAARGNLDLDRPLERFSGEEN